MRFRGKIWETGTSKVLTVPKQLEPTTGDIVWVTLEPTETEEVKSNDMAHTTK